MKTLPTHVREGLQAAVAHLHQRLLVSSETPGSGNCQVRGCLVLPPF